MTPQSDDSDEVDEFQENSLACNDEVMHKDQVTPNPFKDDHHSPDSDPTESQPDE